MNAIAKEALAAVTDADFESAPGYCQRFVRQVVQRALGDQFDHLWAESAKATAQRCLEAGLAVVGEPQPGDLLYRTSGSGGYGHVGIYVGDDRVAENSSTKIGRVQGAKGFRTLRQFGAVDVLVRLDQAEAWTVVFPDGQVLPGVESGGAVFVAARAWATALGLPIEYAERRIRLGGRAVRCDIWWRGDQAWLPVRRLAEAANLAVEPEGRTVRIRRPRTAPAEPAADPRAA